MSLSKFIDKSIAVLSPERALKRQQARSRLELSGKLYRGAENSRLMADWILGKANATPDQWELSTLRERSRDLNRNDPVASGSTDTMSVNIVGSGLSPQSKIRADVVGISETEVVALQHQAERIWDAWGPVAGSDNRLSFDEIQFLAIRKIIEDGEIFAIPTWAKEPWRTMGRVIELAESDRCVSDKQEYDQGIKLGDRGQPISYSFSRQKSQNDLKVGYKEILAHDQAGRPQVLHIFPSKRVGQLRGIPFFAPAMSFFKHLADYLEAEVVAARVAACLSIFITNSDPLGMAAGQGAGVTPDGKRLQSVEPGLVHYMGIGESINVVDPKRPGDAFAPFVEGVLRLIGVSLGLPYELLLKDFSKTNYSSARASLLEGRRNFTNWRSWFSKKFCQPIWELVLEEAYLRGNFDAPNFYKFKSE